MKPSGKPANCGLEAPDGRNCPPKLGFIVMEVIGPLPWKDTPNAIGPGDTALFGYVP